MNNNLGTMHAHVIKRFKHPLHSDEVRHASFLASKREGATGTDISDFVAARKRRSTEEIDMVVAYVKRMPVRSQPPHAPRGLNRLQVDLDGQTVVT